MVTIILCGIAVLVVAAIAEAIYEYISNAQEEQREIEAAIDQLSNEFISSYAFTPADDKLKTDIVNFLKQECPKGLGEQLKQFNSHEERKEYVAQLTNQVADIMGVELEGVIVSDDMEPNTLGLFHEQGYLAINAVVMEADPERIMMTMVHELRHGVQYQSCLQGKDHWGFSTETKATWYYNWNHYINEPFDLYQKQPLEYDANTFANAVIQSYKA